VAELPPEWRTKLAKAPRAIKNQATRITFNVKQVSSVDGLTTEVFAP
jgi:hypothetical protein